MTVIQFIRLLRNNLALLIIVPIAISLITLTTMDDSALIYSTSSKVYTGFASGYSIKNNARDYFAIKTKFDNFFESAKSRSTKEEITLKTIAYYLSKESIADQEMQPDNQALFREIFNNELINSLVVKDNRELTFKNLSKEYETNSENVLYLLINSRESPLLGLFGIEKINDLELRQEGTSDLVLLTYEASDPGVTQITIKIALEVILSKVKMIKSAESNSVVQYFKAKVIRAQNKLDAAEKQLGELMTKNNITNYYEQTKWLAARNEDFEVAFQKEKLGLVAAEAAEKEAIAAMGISSGIKMRNNEILSLRKEIRKLNEQKADKYIFKEIQFRISDSTQVKKETSILNQDTIKQALLSKQNSLNAKIFELLEMKNSAAGIQIEDVASKWLESIIKVEEYKARIIQFIQFEKEFEQAYSRFSKLGSKLKQLERKIGVYERDYLDFVVSLNDAKLIEENIQMSSSLKIIDKPFYPLDPEKSKKGLIVSAAAAVGLIFSLGVLLVLEFIDESIRTPKRLSEKSGLELIGGFPLIETQNIEQTEILHSKLIKQIATFINYSYYENIERPVPFVVIYTSTRKREGKSTIANLVAQELRKSGEKILIIDTAAISNENKETTHEDNISCQRPNNIYDQDISQIIDSYSTNIEKVKYRYIFFEISSIIGNDLPIKAIKNAHLSLLVSKANRIWNKADSMGLKTYKNIAEHNVAAILNGAMVDELETIIGEIPKNRSLLRKKIKKLAKLQFKRKKF